MTGAATHPAYGLVRPVTPIASVLLAPNPSPMTLDGTNTWLLRAPGESTCLVVDPGPNLPEHLARIVEAGPVTAILLTHGHPDHADGARALHDLTGAPVRALDPRHRYGVEGLSPGDVVTGAGLALRVVGTPGHTGDSLSFLVPAAGPSAAAGPSGAAGASAAVGASTAAVLTGDTVLGRGTTVVAHPDGRLGEYLDSLRRLHDLAVESGGMIAVLPGHGPELPDLAAATSGYLHHRVARLEQVRAALALVGPAATAADVVAVVYADVDPVLWPAAELSVRAAVEYLRAGPS